MNCPFLGCIRLFSACWIGSQAARPHSISKLSLAGPSWLLPALFCSFGRAMHYASCWTSVALFAALASEADSDGCSSEADQLCSLRALQPPIACSNTF